MVLLRGKKIGIPFLRTPFYNFCLTSWLKIDPCSKRKGVTGLGNSITWSILPLVLSHYLSMLAILFAFVPGSSLHSGSVCSLSSVKFWSDHKWSPSDIVCSRDSPTSSESSIDYLIWLLSCLSQWWTPSLSASPAQSHMDQPLRSLSVPSWCHFQALSPQFQTSCVFCLLLKYLCFLSPHLPRYFFT